jgi:mono/diheme cytochrome c family protein
MARRHGSFRALAWTCAATWHLAAAAAVLVLSGCQPMPPAPPPDPQAELIEKGRRLFVSETFNGNGRTCATCHPATNNFTLDPAFIARLPKNDPLFVAEFTPALANLEIPELMRAFALIRENLDGFDDLDNKFVMRGVPHVLGLRNSVASPGGPRTGWSGDGAPGDGSLRSFAAGAVIQHFTKRLDRVAGVDFRLPRDDELDALEAFQLSLGRQRELVLPLPLKSVVAKRGQEIFLDRNVGKCSICHQAAGANANFGGGSLGNANFNTGVEAMPDQPARLTKQRVPEDDGFGRPGDGTFNTPSLVEAADSGPFFHNNSVATLEAAVAFYDGDSFNESPAGQTLAKATNGKGIEIDATQIQAIASFLRVINALENIRAASELFDGARRPGVSTEESEAALVRGIADTADAIRVLSEVRLHPDAIGLLAEAQRLARQAQASHFQRHGLLGRVNGELGKARAELVGSP